MESAGSFVEQWFFLSLVLLSSTLTSPTYVETTTANRCASLIVLLPVVVPSVAATECALANAVQSRNKQICI